MDISKQLKKVRVGEEVMFGEEVVVGEEVVSNNWAMSVKLTYTHIFLKSNWI